MKCPHCLDSFFEKWNQSPLSQSTPPGLLVAQWQVCPSCSRFIVKLQMKSRQETPSEHEWIAYPKGATRPVPPEVKDPYKQDFVEACLVLPDSEKASAALARRCLQSILRDEANTKQKDLADQIDEVIDTGK